MADVSLSPEAFGTLLAMKRLPKLRHFDPSVAEELTRVGLAKLDDGVLTLTSEGKQARRDAKDARQRLKRDHARSSKKQRPAPALKERKPA